MNKQRHKERTERMQESGGKLRGGTVGNVWEWGTLMSREDALMRMGDDEFEAIMNHYEDVANYEAEIARLKALIPGYSDPA